MESSHDHGIDYLVLQVIRIVEGLLFDYVTPTRRNNCFNSERVGRINYMVKKCDRQE